MSEPIIKIQDRSLSAGVFEFKNQNGTTLSIDIQRSYKAKDAQEWTRENIHCYEDDLLKIANLCIRTYNAICNRRSGSKPAQAQPAQAAAPAPAQVPVDDSDSIPF